MVGGAMPPLDQLYRVQKTGKILSQYDSAERGCHFITEFMNQVHSEDARQDLVQCVQYWRSMIQSDLSKESLKNI